MSAVKRFPVMDARRKALGMVLRKHRKALGLSQEKMAERLDLHRNYVSLVERGLQNITLETLCKIAEVLGCTPSGLLAEVEREVASATAGTPRPEFYPHVVSPFWEVAEPPPC